MVLKVIFGMGRFNREGPRTGITEGAIFLLRVGTDSLVSQVDHFFLLEEFKGALEPLHQPIWYHTHKASILHPLFQMGKSREQEWVALYTNLDLGTQRIISTLNTDVILSC